MARLKYVLLLIEITLLSTAKSQIPIPEPDFSPSDKPILYLIATACFNGHKTHALTYQPAFQWGLDMVNARDDILPNYEIRVIWSDSQCSAGIGMFNLYKHLNSPPTKIMFIGAIYSFVSEAVGLIAHKWNLVEITPASISPALSNKDKYPLLFRINTPYITVVEPHIALLKQFNWKRVSTIYETKEIYSQLIDKIISLLPENNITLTTSEIFAHDPTVQVKNLKKHDARIIIGGFYELAAVRVFCAAYKVGWYGPKIVWIIPGWFVGHWPEKYMRDDVDCSPEEVYTASHWAFGMTSVAYNYKNVAGLAGMRPSDFQEQFIREKLNGEYPSSIGMSGPGRCIDTAFVIGWALQYAETVLRERGSPKRLEDFTYEDQEIKDLIFQGMHNVSFQGVKGYMKFDERGDPIGAVMIVQYLYPDVITTGYHDPMVGEFQWVPGTPMVWQGGVVPKDSVTRYETLIFVQTNTYIGMCSVATIGVVLSLFFLGFNIIYRNKRFIKMSSPMMNNVIVLGSIVAYAVIFLQETSDSSVLLFCKLRAYALMIGFSIAFGALFAKTWRVYMIFTRTTKKTVLKDYQLVLIVIILCGIDVILIILRELLDPLSVAISTNGITELDNGDTVVTEKSIRCISHYSLYFKGIVFCIKGLLLVFGAFLSYQTRKVTIPALNDSKFIGICIYNIAVLSLLGVIMSFVLIDKINLSYMFVGGFIVFGTTITQLIIFVPKVIKFKSGKVDDADMNTVGTMNVEVPTTGLSTNLETGMEGQNQELDDTKAFIEQLKKEIGELKNKKEIS